MIKRILMVCLIACMAFSACAETNLIDEWDSVSRIPGSEEVFLVRQGELWGVASRDGEIIQEPLFHNEPVFENGYAVVARKDFLKNSGFSGEDTYGSLFGLMNSCGEITIPAEFDSLSVSDGIVVAQVNEQVVYMNVEGETLIGEKFFRAQPFVGDYAAVARKMDLGDKNRDSDNTTTAWGMIDREGNEIIPLEYDMVEICENGMVIVSMRNKSAYFGSDGKALTDFKYFDAGHFINGYAAVSIDADVNGTSGDDLKDLELAWGAIDEKCREVVPCMYDSIEICENGLMLVQQDNQYGYINAGNEFVIPLKYYLARPFKNGCALVARKVQLKPGDENYDLSNEYELYWGLIDETGKEILPLEFDRLDYLENSSSTVQLGSEVNGVRRIYEIRNGKAVEAD